MILNIDNNNNNLAQVVHQKSNIAEPTLLVTNSNKCGTSSASGSEGAISRIHTCD